VPVYFSIDAVLQCCIIAQQLAGPLTMRRITLPWEYFFAEVYTIIKYFYLQPDV